LIETDNSVLTSFLIPSSGSGRIFIAMVVRTPPKTVTLMLQLVAATGLTVPKNLFNHVTHVELT